MDSNRTLSQEMQRETKIFNSGLVTVGLGELALVGAIALQHRFKEVEGVQVGLIVGGIVTVGRGIVQMVSSGSKLQQFQQERNALNNSDNS